VTTQPTTSLYDLTLAELEAGLVERGQPKYRAKQIFDWAYNHLVEDYEAMSNLPAALRTLLSDYTKTTPERMQALAARYLGQNKSWRAAVVPEGSLAKAALSAR